MEASGGGGPRNQRTLLVVMAVAAVAAVTFAALAVGGVFTSDDEPEPAPPPTTALPPPTRPAPVPLSRRPIAGHTLTIYSSLPLQGASRIQATAIENGAKLALREHKGRVGRYTVRYQPLDDSTASSGRADLGRTAA